MKQPNDKHGYRILVLGTFLAIVFYCLVSCSITKDKTETISESKTQNDITTSKNTASKLDAYKTGFSIKPIDLTRPIVFGGKEYFNSEIIYTTEKSSGTTNAKEDKKDNSSAKAKDEESTKSKKEASDMTWLLYLIGGVVAISLPLGALIIFLGYKSINKNTDTMKAIAEKLG